MSSTGRDKLISLTAIDVEALYEESVKLCTKKGIPTTGENIFALLHAMAPIHAAWIRNTTAR